MPDPESSPLKAFGRFMAANKIWWIGPIVLVFAVIFGVILLGSLGAGIPPMYR